MKRLSSCGEQEGAVATNKEQLLARRREVKTTKKTIDNIFYIYI